MLSQLQQIIDTLKAKDAVDAVLLTGSHGENRKPYSDIDLVIILTENAAQLKALYTWIDGIFADIFFFDKKDVEEAYHSDRLPANGSDLLGSLYVWTHKGEIQFDKSGTLAKLKSRQIALEVLKDQQAEHWNGINYNYEANTRYFNAGDQLYHTALEMRLLYSIPQLISGYFLFRSMPWEGEKHAFAYLREHEPELYKEFNDFTNSPRLEDRFSHYQNMVKMVLTADFPLWKRNEVLPQPLGRSAQLSEPKLIEYWEKLISD